jgi:hypothetical protein
MRSGGRLERRELQLCRDRKLRLRATVGVVHQLVRTSLATGFGRIRWPLHGMQLNVRDRRARMVKGLMKRTSGRNHRLNDQT